MRTARNALSSGPPEKANDLPMKDPRSSPEASGTAPVGARHDDSSLFSLDALKKTEDEARQQKGRDDSGLIDLKALAALEREPRPKQEMAVAAVVAPPDLFQLSGAGRAHDRAPGLDRASSASVARVAPTARARWWAWGRWWRLPRSSHAFAFHPRRW